MRAHKIDNLKSELKFKYKYARHYTEHTGLRVLCSLKLSSSTADWSFDKRNFLRDPSPPSSSSLIPPEPALSNMPSSPVPWSLSFLFPLELEFVLLGEEGTPACTSSSLSSLSVTGARFMSIPRRDVGRAVLVSVDKKVENKLNFELVHCLKRPNKIYILHSRYMAGWHDIYIYIDSSCFFERLRLVPREEKEGMRLSWRDRQLVAAVIVGLRLRLSPRSSFPIIISSFDLCL